MRAALVNSALRTGREFGRRSVVSGFEVARISLLWAKICFLVHYVVDDSLVLFVFCARTEFLSAQRAEYSIGLVTRHFQPPRIQDSTSIVLRVFDRHFECLAIPEPLHFFGLVPQPFAVSRVGSREEICPSCGSSF
jgi:hypothetical protein